MSQITAYVHGTYDKSLKVFGYGCIFVHDGKEERRIGFGGDAENNQSIAGHISGASAAIEYALQNRFNKLTIIYEYEGLAMWANGLWQARKNMAIEYQDFARRARNLGLAIDFEKGYSSDKYVVEVRSLSKEAVSEAEKSGFCEILSAAKKTENKEQLPEGQLPLVSYTEEGDNDEPPFDLDDSKAQSFKDKAKTNAVPRVPFQKSPEEFITYFINKYVDKESQEEAGRILYHYLVELR